ncbi:LPS export ABC transporter periplasmic protein LptC [Chthonobacter albigriseus]|uniref:LPS export ABC transporter periplasmic protein LptC n=1 Tax=Chthonobacter albigriseus TaxID=1683161 RepID=UPI0015EE4BCE|nr:LPS export ABC transporter periplasmic protein LptC [Chthonobacter albigriseus]
MRRRAFEHAARQSKRIRRLRVALPLLGVALFGAVVGITILSRIELALTFGDLSISSEGLAMAAPKLSGSDGKGRTYSVQADRAVQDLGNPKLIRLYGINAHIRQADGRTADFGAGSGIYDAGKQTLVLDEDITIRSDDGSAAGLERATIDLATGDVQSNAPIAFSSSLGSIQAKGMSVEQKGGSVTFRNGVKMTVDPNAVQSGVPEKGDLTHGQQPSGDQDS